MIKQIAIVIVLKKIVDELEIWMQVRENEPFKGMWEFPGGKIEPNENPITAAIRELKEEVGVELSPNELKLLTIEHTYPTKDKIVVLNVFVSKSYTKFSQDGFYKLSECINFNDFNQMIPAPNKFLLNLLENTSKNELNF